jgi:hypothetical protein
MTYRIPSIGALTLAVLAHLAPASGAELPARSPEAVESRRSCASQGAGFFSIPGSETCLKISGRVRAEYGLVPSRGRVETASGLRTGARVQLDARTPTPYGPLRAVIRYDTRAMRD